MPTRSANLSMRLTGAAASLVILGSACGPSTTASTSVAPPATAVAGQPTADAPTIEQFEVLVSGSTATVVAVADGIDDGRVLIDWGDGTTAEVAEGLPLVRAQHQYAVTAAHPVSLTAVDDSGRTAVASGVADVLVLASTTVPASTEPGSTEPGTTVPATTAPPTTAPPTTTPPSTTPPATAPPTTAPPTTAPPAPLPEPVELDLLDDVTSTGSSEGVGSPGPSGSHAPIGNQAYRVKSDAGLSFGGTGSASGSLAVGVEAFELFPDLPDRVEEIEVSVDWSAVIEVSGQLYTPADHQGSFTLTTALSEYSGDGLADEEVYVAVEERAVAGEGRERRPIEFSGGGMITAVITRDAPVAEFSLNGVCSMSRGNRGSALGETGSCDSGVIELESVRFTLTPVDLD